jgi:hypothetical protein
MLRCVGTVLSCRAQALEHLSYVVGRDVLNIPSVGKRALGALQELGYIASVVDLFQLPDTERVRVAAMDIAAATTADTEAAEAVLAQTATGRGKRTKRPTTATAPAPAPATATAPPIPMSDVALMDCGNRSKQPLAPLDTLKGWGPRKVAKMMAAIVRHIVVG